MDLPRGFGDRLLYGIGSAFIALFLAPFLVLVYFWAPETFLLVVVRYIVQDTLLLFFLAFVLALVWCLFAPRWVERMLSNQMPKLIVFSVIFVVGLTILLVATEAIRAF